MGINSIGTGTEPDPRGRRPTINHLQPRKNYMTSDVLICQFGLINFAISSLITIGLSTTPSKNYKQRLHCALITFTIGTLMVTVALCLSIIDGPTLGRLRGLALITCLSWITVLANHYYNMLNISVFFYPIVTILMLILSFSPPIFQETEAKGPSTFLALHIIGAFMGQILALCATLASVIYLWKDYRLKKRLIGQLSPKLPALDILEQILWVCLPAGFFFLTLALASGTYYSCTAFPKIQTSIDKIIWAILVWIWYLSVILLKRSVRCNTKKLAQLSLMGFFLLASSLFGMLFI